MTIFSSEPQISVRQVSFVPRLFRTAQHRHSVPPASADYVLREVSFDLFQGDRIALVGASGSGKTSLLRLLNRLSEPTQGTIYLKGQRYEKIPVVQLRQQVVLVPQESKLLGMTVQEALAYPLHLRGLEKQTVHTRLAEWMERLHIPADWLNRTEVQLSVGQRQVVAIARALVIRPTVLLLDEPTSALDVGRTQQVLKTLIDLANTGTTVMIVSHQLDLMEQFCTRLLHLQQGALVQDQTERPFEWAALYQSLQAIAAQDTKEWD